MIFTKTRIALVLAFGLILGVAGFVLLPSLVPQLNEPIEDVAGDSADSDVQAQGSTPSAETAASGSACNAEFTGIIMHRFDDGSVLFRFGDGHKVRVEALIGGEARNAVTTYGDGTALVEDFETGSKVEELPYLDPLKEGWYDLQGKPQEVRPPEADYPDLWPRIAEEFDFPELDPPGQLWNDPDYRPPADIDEAISRWGYPVDSYQGTDFQCVIFANGVEWCAPYEEGDPILVYYPDETLDIVYSPDRVERIQPYKPSENSVPRQRITTYGDGTKVVREYPSPTRLQDMDSTEPLNIEWFDPQGNPRSAPAAAEYPQDKIGRLPLTAYEPRISGLTDHPWGDKWETLEPPGGNRQDAEIFGPVRKVILEDDGETVWSWFADGTVKEGRSNLRVYRNRGRVIILHYYKDAPMYIHYGEDEGRPQVCPGQGEEIKEDVVRMVRIKYPDGVVRRFFVAPSTSEKEFSTAERYCDTWERDGQPIDPLPPDSHPILDLPAEFTGRPPSALFD